MVIAGREEPQEDDHEEVSGGKEAQSQYIRTASTYLIPGNWSPVVSGEQCTLLCIIIP